jgi:hypothetical protein
MFLVRGPRDGWRPACERNCAHPGRSILLGLELLAGADIIDTITAPLTYESGAEREAYRSTGLHCGRSEVVGGYAAARHWAPRWHKDRRLREGCALAFSITQNQLLGAGRGLARLELPVRDAVGEDTSRL